MSTLVITVGFLFFIGIMFLCKEIVKEAVREVLREEKDRPN